MTRLAVFSLSGINKIALSSNTFKHSKLRNFLVWSRCHIVRHNNIASLYDTVLRSQFTNACFFFEVLTFQVVTCSGKAGLISKTPLKNLLTKDLSQKECLEVVLQGKIMQTLHSLLYYNLPQH